MSFRPSLNITLIFVLASCGILGEKSPRNARVEFSSDGGCFDDFGENAKKFIKGQVDPERWRASFDCAIDALDLFVDFARGSEENGFNVDDMHSMVSRALITDRTVPSGLVQNYFDIKSAVLGGPKNVVSKSDLEFFIELLEIVKERSVPLIAPLRDRIENPVPEKMLALSDAISDFGDELARKIPSSGSMSLIMDRALNFIRNSNEVHGWAIDPRWIEFLYALKPVFAAGSSSEIETDRWRKLIQVGGRLIGLGAAVTSVDEREFESAKVYSNFRLGVIKRAEEVLDRAFRVNSSGLAYSVLDQIIETVPNGVLDGRNLGLLKQAVRRFVKRFLEGESENSLSEASVDFLMSIAKQWNRNKTHLDAIFDDYHLNKANVPSERFIGAAEQYKVGRDSRTKSEVDRLIYLSQKFPTMYQQGNKQVTYLHGMNNTETNLSMLSIFDLIASHLIRAYADGASKNFATLDDFKLLLKEFGEVAFDFKVIDITIPRWADKRFGESDMFTYVSDGDGVSNHDEITGLLAIVYSITRLMDRVIEGSEPVCKNGDGKDVLDVEWMDYDCFRAHFYENRYLYWDHFPQLLDFYDRSSLKTKQQFELALEGGYRRFGKTVPPLPIASADILDLVGITHYIETIFTRFDANEDGRLKLNEAMEAYPKFKLKIAEVAEIDPKKDKRLRSIFTWMVHNGAPPDEKDIWELIKFLLWEAAGPTWWKRKIDSNRLNIFQLASFFNPSEPLPPPEPSEP